MTSLYLLGLLGYLLIWIVAWEDSRRTTTSTWRWGLTRPKSWGYLSCASTPPCHRGKNQEWNRSRHQWVYGRVAIVIVMVNIFTTSMRIGIMRGFEILMSTFKMCLMDEVLGSRQSSKKRPANLSKDLTRRISLKVKIHPGIFEFGTT